MLATPSATPSGVTPDQRREIYVEHTADAEKAEVFQQNLPAWLSDAELKTVQALKATFDEAHASHTKACQVLEKLKPLDVFCKEELTRFFKQKWSVDVDAERDTLEVIRRTIVTLNIPFPTDFEEVVSTTSRSLLDAAMENFTSDQPDDFSDESFIRLDGRSRLGTAITPGSFATLCRELDLGARYQRHIDEVLALPAKPVGNAPLDATASAADVRRLKWLEMEIAIHIAYSKKHISADGYATMLSVVEQDVPAAKTKGALFDGAPIIWQGLMIHDACICGALVFTKVSINAAPKAKCVVYMPNEPVRPLYEYDSLDDFKLYLTLKLQTKSYRKTFSQQYLPGHDKTDFFAAFDEDNTLGTLVATPAAVCVSDFFFSAFLSKTQKDARVLAVPTEDVDEEQWKKTLQRLLDDGLLLLNAASFFVPVLGQLMAVAAVVDIVSDVYEGVVDWTHGERNKALSHLLNVVESVAQMAAFAVGGKVLKNVLGKVGEEQAAFYDGFEAVAGSDGKARLWKPDLKPYQQASPSAALKADSEGLYREGARTSVRMDGATYDVVRNAKTQQWQIKHPERTDAFQPAIERNVEGGWRHLHEHAHEWPDSGYALQRTASDLQSFSRSQLARIADITDLSPAELFRRHDSRLKLPARVNDCIERFRLDERITRAITAMEAGQFANAEFAQEQLHTLPRLPGWPAKLVIEVSDEKGVVNSRFPESAAKTEGVNSLRVSQAQLEAGQLLDTVSKSLYVKEVENIVGTSTVEPNAADARQKNRQYPQERSSAAA